MNLLSALRYLQGERPGMRAGGPYNLSHQQAIFFPSLTIQTQVRLPDVSYYQGPINFAVMRRVADGVIIRAGQRTWVDVRFKENWQKAKEAGLPRGSYWFYDSREDPRRQAELWWSLLAPDPGELVHVADFEESYGGPYGTPAHMRTFLEHFQHISGIPDTRVSVYTAFYWWGQRVGNNLFFARFQLWLAWYALMSVVRVPLPWTEADLLFWQYTPSGPGDLYGVSSREIDLSWYCCTPASYSLRFGLGAPLPPDQGGPMSTYYKWTAVAANIRADHTAGSADRGDLVNGDVIQVDDPRVGGWLPFRHAWHADGTWVKLTDGTPLDNSNTTTFWSPDSYFVQVASFPAPPPEPDPEPPPASHVVEVYIDGVLEFRRELS